MKMESKIILSFFDLHRPSFLDGVPTSSISISSFVFSVESLCFVCLRETIERSIHPARVSQWISRQSSDKCFLLASALNSLARRISREDLQITVTSLLQCATNIVTVRSFPENVERENSLWFRQRADLFKDE